MDPVSLTASVITMVQMAESLISYLKDVKDCPKDSKLLLQEASNLSSLLARLKCRLEEARSTDPWFQQIRLLNTEGGALDQFRKNLESLVGKIDANTGRHRIKQATLWEFTKNEVIETLNRIERLKSLIASALADDHFTLSKAVQAEVSGIKDKLNRIANYHESAEFQKFFSWLKTPDPSTNYNAALKKRQEGTGSWLISEPHFVEWKTSVGKPMWLHGKPGCGKTILSASVLSDPDLHFENEARKPLGFFYCDFGDSAKQTLQSLVRSLLLQLASQISGGHQIVQQLYDKYRNGDMQPSDEAAERCLYRIINTSGEVYIVIDALDECNERDALLTFLEELLDQCGNNLHILMTSRREHDITEKLSHIVTFEIDLQSKLVDGDIKLYVQESLAKDSKLNKWPESIKTEIMENLISKANGMFRWVFCQLDSLRKCATPRNIRKTLSSLPKTLDKTYERIWAQIEEDGHLEDAILILQFLCYSKRVLRLLEIVEILAVGVDGDFSCEERMPNPELIQVICSTFINLISVKDHGGYLSSFVPHGFISRGDEVRLGHYSVQEYLVSNRNPYFDYFTPEASQASLARVCLIYLIDACGQPLLDERGYTFSRQGTKTVANRLFVEYSAENWWKHLAIIQKDMPADLMHLTMTLLEERFLLPWTQLYAIERDGTYTAYWIRPDECTLGPAIYYASFAGLPKIVSKLIEQDHDPNSQGGFYGSALQAASYRGYQDIVQLLLKDGADANLRGGYYGTALQTASYRGYQNIVQILLDRGANINIQGGEYGTALQAASYKGCQAIVQLLLDRGANINIESGDLGSALQAASFEGHQAIVQLLLDRGANINNKSGSYRSALQAASFEGHQAIVQLLVDRGANINIESGTFGSALQAASFRGHQEIVQILLDRGANINKKSGSYGSALQAASFEGHQAIVQLLLDRGANINIESGDLGSALQAASYKGYQAIVQILLNRGADINMESGYYGTALQAASSGEGHPEVVQMLLDRGADINIQGGYYGTALQAASSMGHHAIVQILLDRGADINIQGGKYGTALQAASNKGWQAIVQMLLDQGQI